jgi:hypothetical protein
MLALGVPSGWRYPQVGGCGYGLGAEKNLKPRKRLKNAQTPTCRVHAVLARFLPIRFSVLLWHRMRLRTGFQQLLHIADIARILRFDSLAKKTLSPPKYAYGYILTMKSQLRTIVFWDKRRYSISLFEWKRDFHGLYTVLVGRLPSRDLHHDFSCATRSFRKHFKSGTNARCTRRCPFCRYGIRLVFCVVGWIC